MAVCGGCGKFGPEEARFCSACGSPLGAAPLFERSARKTVTVVFADIAGSTELGDRLDPETVRQVMSRYFRTTRRVLERHGGTVEKFIGDAVMAVFGIPVVHEDDALRATRASVEMAGSLGTLNKELERRWGVSLEVRIGVNTGEVVTGDPSGGQGFATGDAINLAARLQQAAAPGEILIGETTRGLLGDRVTVEEVTPFLVKGKRGYVRAARVLTLTSDTPSTIMGSPFVGREEELRLLRETFERCVAERACRLVTVLGVPGIGKSRLVREALEEIRTGAGIVVDAAAGASVGVDDTSGCLHCLLRGWRGASLRWTSRLQLWTDPD